MKYTNVEEQTGPAAAIGQTENRERGKRNSVPLRPLRRLNLVRGAVERLREQIILGAFGPDSVLPSEGQLGQALGVSRTVVREAMRILSAQGLVDVSQGRQSRVRASDPQVVVDTFHTYLQRSDHSLLDLIEVRLPLETAIAALAAERATADHIRKLIESIEEFVAAKGLDRQIDADIQFHGLLADATGNPVFQLLLKTVAGLMRRSRLETLSRTGVERALVGHRAVLAAIERHDPEAARLAMIEHLSSAEEDLRGQATSAGG